MLEAFAFVLCDQYIGAMIKKADTLEPLWMCCKTEAHPPPPCNLLCLVYITKYCYGEEKLMSRVWQIYMFSAPLNAKKWFLISYLSVYMNVHLASAWVLEQILFRFGIQEFIHPRLVVPTESEHSNWKIWGPLDGPRNIKFQFSQKWL